MRTFERFLTIGLCTACAVLFIRCTAVLFPLGNGMAASGADPIGTGAVYFLAVAYFGAALLLLAYSVSELIALVFRH